MKRILPLILGSVAFIVAFPPTLQAQDVYIGPGDVTIHRHHRDWERERERQRELRREHWRHEYYEHHGYYPEDRY